MHQIFGYYNCSIEFILLKLGNRARAALTPCIFFVAQVLVYFKDMFNKYLMCIDATVYILKRRNLLPLPIDIVDF
jgi:hypothetical protein